MQATHGAPHILYRSCTSCVSTVSPHCMTTESETLCGLSQVNNAGITRDGVLLRMKESSWKV
jgi:hypothetical protein